MATDITAEQLTDIFRAADFRMKDLERDGWSLQIYRVPDSVLFKWTANNRDGRSVSGKKTELGRRDCVKAAWRKLVQEARA